MTDVYIATILLAVTFLLICWVVTEFQIYRNSHSMEEELGKPRFTSRLSAWQIRFFDMLNDVLHFRQDKLKEENRMLFLFGMKRRNRKEEYRMAGKAR